MEPLPYTFTHDEVDLLVCALLKYQTELRIRTPLMERFASSEHLANHTAKIARGEALLERFKMKGPCLDPACNCYAEIERLKALLTRAADALEGKPVYDALENYKLIAELRKAAE